MNLELSKIETLATKIVDAYRTVLADKNITAAGQLGQTAKATVELNGNRLIVILNLEEYWKYVEYGRRPGKMPPIAAIEEWIRIKPVIPDAINGKVPSSRQLAYLIARKIGWDGIPGKRPLETALYNDVTEDVIAAIKNEIVRQLNQVLLDQLK